MGEMDGLRGVKGVRDRKSIVDRTGYDGNHRRNEENKCDSSTDTWIWETRPVGHRGEQIKLGGDKGNQECQSCSHSNDIDGRQGVKDGAMSGTHRDSKRVETGPLAENESSQHKQHERKMVHAPRPSIPPIINSRWTTNQLNPPHCHGRLKPQSTRISNPIDGPTRSHGHIKAVSGGLDMLYMLYTNCRWCRRVPKAQYTKMVTLESIKAECAHLEDSTTTSQATTYHIR